MGSDTEFEQGRIVCHAQEQRRLETYFHDRLAPDLMSQISKGRILTMDIPWGD